MLLPGYCAAIWLLVQVLLMLTRPKCTLYEPLQLLLIIARIHTWATLWKCDATDSKPPRLGSRPTCQAQDSITSWTPAHIPGLDWSNPPCLALPW